MDNKGRCKLLGDATKGSYKDQFATPFANLSITAPWHEEHSILLGDIGLHRVIRLLIWLWCFILVISVKESILNVFISRTQNKLRDSLKIFHPWRYKISFNGASSQSGRITCLKAACYRHLRYSSVYKCYSVPAIWHRRSLYGDFELVRNQGAIIGQRNFPRCVVTAAT